MRAPPCKTATLPSPRLTPPSSAAAMLRQGARVLRPCLRAAPLRTFKRHTAAAAADAAATEQPAQPLLSKQPLAEQQQAQQRPKPLQLDPLPAEQLARNAALVERLRGQTILAPLTRGNHLPFRRLVSLEEGLYEGRGRQRFGKAAT